MCFATTGCPVPLAHSLYALHTYVCFSCVLLQPNAISSPANFIQIIAIVMAFISHRPSQSPPKLVYTAWSPRWPDQFVPQRHHAQMHQMYQLCWGCRPQGSVPPFWSWSSCTPWQGEWRCWLVLEESVLPPWWLHAQWPANPICSPWSQSQNQMSPQPLHVKKIKTYLRHINMTLHDCMWPYNVPYSQSNFILVNTVYHSLTVCLESYLCSLTNTMSKPSHLKSVKCCI